MSNPRPKLIAIVGGSGAGKTWLADHLQQSLGATAARLSLDNFYRARPHLAPALRETINFDNPRAIDWPLFETVLRNFRKGRTVCVPRYDFATHTRLRDYELWMPRPLVLVDGLWLLERRAVRELFDLSIYLDCPEDLRLERRAARDVIERGRTLQSVREQFTRAVAPMHNRYVAPQLKHADIILKQPLHPSDTGLVLQAVQRLAATRSLRRKRAARPAPISRPSEILVGGAVADRLSEISDYALAS